LLLISHLKQPDPDVARELAVASGPLSFTALKALTPEVDRELAAHLGSLEPDAVAELLPATAAILVKHGGALSLKSAEPGDESLLVLSAYRGRLELGLTIVSEAPPQIPARPAGHLRLPLLLKKLRSVSPELAVELAAHKSTLELAGVKLPRPAKIQATRRLKSVFVGKTRRNNISRATANETLPDSVPDTVSALQQRNCGD
jgi:hypothetical protein